MVKRIVKRAFNVKHVGGLLFFRIGRFGGSFYLARPNL